MGKGGRRVERALSDPSYLRVANIIGITNLDSNNDVNQIEDYIRKNGDPYQNALDAANQATADIQARSVQNLNDLTIGFQQSIASMQANFDSKYANLQAKADERYANLNNVLIQRTDAFNQQLKESNDQLLEMTDSYNEQVRVAGNQARANVPVPNQGAQGATAGDDRLNLFNNTVRRKKETDAKDLSILTGIGSQGNPLAGLQIA